MGHGGGETLIERLSYVICDCHRHTIRQIKITEGLPSLDLTLYSLQKYYGMIFMPHLLLLLSEGQILLRAR